MTEEAGDDAMATPELSVVIATYNRAGPLHVCLDALARQEGIGGAFEVVVVVDGSTDGTRELLARYQSPYLLRVVEQANGGQCRALNRGVGEAAGRYCLLLDDDIIAGPALVVEHLAAQREGGGVLGVGRLELKAPLNADWYVRQVREAWKRHYARLDSGETRLRIADCYSGNLSFPRAAFQAVGGFAEDFRRGYDTELAFRLAQAGLPLVYVPRAAAVHDDAKSSRELLRDLEREAANNVAIYRRHPAALSSLGLDRFRDDGPAEVAVRRLLLTLNFPVGPLCAIGSLLTRLGRGTRWTRFVRHYVFWRGVRAALADDDTWHSLTSGVTILLYHAVAAAGERPSRFVVSARDFEWQMRWLARRGYRVLSLGEYVRYRQNHRLSPPRSVVLTFDDGYADNATVAAPILAKHGFPATIFLVTDLVGRRNEWDAHGVLAGRPLMDWQTARSLERAGVSFGPHGRSHRALKQLSAAELDGEIGSAWATLERSLDHPVRVFAFPFGLFDDAARAAVARAGLHAACTVKLGRNWLSVPLDSLRRTEVRGDTGRLAFRLAVWRGKPHLPGFPLRLWASVRPTQSTPSSSRSQVTTPS